MSDSTSALEREAEQTRARIADTAETLRAKMTPGQMVDEMSSMFRGSDGEAALVNLKNQVRDNPLPLALVGAGLAWLALGKGTSLPSGETYRDNRRDYSRARPVSASAFRDPVLRDEFDPDYGSASDSPFGQPSDYPTGSASDSDEPGIIERSTQAASDAWDATTSALDDAAHAVGDKLSRASHSASDAGSRFANQAADFRSQATRGTAQKARNLADSASDLFQREPLATAAVGLAIGALIGTLLPHTRTEDEQMGALSDSVKAQAKDLAAEGYEQAKEVAGETYSAAKKEADKQGLNPSDVDTSELHLADRVGSVIKSAARAGEDAAREKLGETSDANPDTHAQVSQQGSEPFPSRS